ncbi:MAG: hypothetical protein WCT11_01940 [Candidatus Magasanikbacteria bacterium]
MAIHVVAVAATTVVAPIVAAGVFSLGVQDAAKAISDKATKLCRKASGMVIDMIPDLPYDDYCD